MEILKHVTKSERKVIVDVIESLKLHNCVTVFNNYINAKYSDIDSQYERDYHNILNNSLNSFGQEILREYFENMSPEQRVEVLIEAHMDCPYSFCNACDNYEVDWFLNTYVNDPAERLKKVQKYMYACLEKLDANIARTNKEKELEQVQKSYDNAKKYMEKYQAEVKMYEERLAKLNK